MKISKAEKRRAAFSPRGSDCPICKQDFRHCPHTRDEAEAKLDRDVLAARGL